MDDKVIEFKDNAWIYKNGAGSEIREETAIKKYGQKINTQTTDGKTFMQAHHGIQNAWAKQRLEKYGYRESDAPAMLLRDSCKGTPHQYITASQTKRKFKIQTRTYSEERELVDKESQNIDIPKSQIDEYLKEADMYFKSIYDKTPAKERIEIFGKKICNL